MLISSTTNVPFSKPISGNPSRSEASAGSVKLDSTDQRDSAELQKLAGNLASASSPASQTPGDVTDETSAGGVTSLVSSLFQRSNNAALNAHSGLTSERVLQLLAD